MTKKGKTNAILCVVGLILVLCVAYLILMHTAITPSGATEIARTYINQIRPDLNINQRAGKARIGSATVDFPGKAYNWIWIVEFPAIAGSDFHESVKVCVRLNGEIITYGLPPRRN